MNGTQLVTGATGFIGSHVTQRLVADGERPRVYVRNPELISEDLRGKVEVYKGDLNDRVSLEHAISGTDAVINCAGLSTDWAKRSAFDASNVTGVETLLNVLKTEAPNAHLIHLSTTDVYGYPKMPCDETGTLDDVGLPYNATKVAGDRLVQAHIKQGLHATILRPVTVWGPRSEEWVVEVGNLLRQRQMFVIDGGQTGAGLLYVENLVEVIRQFTGNVDAFGRILNVRDDRSVTWAEYLDALAQCFDGERVGWHSMPGGLANAGARVMEALWSVARARKRPLLTRHAVALMRRDQDYSVDALLKFVDTSRFLSFEAAMQRTHAWIKSEDSGMADGST